MSNTTKETRTEEETQPQEQKSNLPFLLGGLTLLIIFIISDLYLKDTYMSLSCKLSKTLQDLLGNPGFVISWILSYPITIFTVLFVYSHTFYTDNYTTSIHYIFLFSLQMYFVVFLKALYARGRPAIIGDDLEIRHCSCDYGMPSGHSSSALAGLYILDIWFWRIYKGKVGKGKLRSLTFLLYFFVFGIGFSRIYYAAHSFSQVFYGYLISLIAIFYLTENRIKRLIEKGNPRYLKSLSFVLLGFSLISIVSLFIYNKNKPQDPSWKYWSRCPNCDGSFAYKQLGNLTFLFVPPGLLLGLGINMDFNLEINYNFPKNDFIYKIKKFGILVLALLIVAIPSLGLSFISYIIDNNSKEIPYVQKAIFISILAYFFGVILTAGGPLLYKKFVLAVESDFIHKKRETTGLVVLGTSYEEQMEKSEGGGLNSKGENN